MKRVLLVLALLLGPSVFAQSPDDRLTRAACNGDLTLVRRYVRAGDRPSDKALFCASAYNFNAEMTDLLLAHGANPDAVYTHSDPLSGATFRLSMLQYATQAGRQDIATVLLSRRARIDLVQPAIAPVEVPYATTALSLAAARGQLPMARFLLELHADPNADQGTALFAVVTRPELAAGESILQALLAAGGDPTLRNAQGQSVCELASGPRLEALQSSGRCP